MKKAFLSSLIFILLFTLFLIFTVFYLNITQMNELNLAQTRNVTFATYALDDIRIDLLDYLQLSVSVGSNSTNTIINVTDTLPSPYTNPSTELSNYQSFITGMYSNQTNLINSSNNSVISFNITTFNSTPSIQFINSNSSLNLNYTYTNLTKNELIVNGSSAVTNYSIIMSLNASCLNSNCTNATWAGGPPNIDSSTVGMWHFDEGNGTTTADSSGTGNTGTLYNSPTWVGGRFVGALQFNGSHSNEEVMINNSSSLNLNGSLTVELWFEMPQIYSLVWLLNKDDSSSRQNSNYYVYIDGNNKISGGIGNSSSYQEIESNSSISANTWYHVAFTSDGTTLRMYVNGILVNSTQQTITPAINSQPLLIGIRATNAYLYAFTGTIDEVAIYNRTKSAQEIAADANLFQWDWGPLAINNNISAAWHFDEGTGTAAYDSSGNGNMVTLAGSNSATLLPSSVNPAYASNSTTTDSPNQATTEFGTSDYTKIDASDSDYEPSTTQDSITQSCSSPSAGTCTSGCDPDCNGGNPSGCILPTPHCTAESHTSNSDTCTASPSCASHYNHIGQCCSYTSSCTTSGGCTYLCASGYYDTDLTASNGCENTTPSYLFGFQRYTFNLSAYSSITSMTFCWQGYYTTTGGQNSSNLLWYNVSSSSWTSWQQLPYNSANIYCITFSGSNLTDVQNSTGTWVQFAVRVNESRQGNSSTDYADYAYLNVSSSVSIAPWTTGKFNDGVSLSGTVYGTANDSASLEITNQLTIEAWVNPATVAPAYQTILFKGNSSAENYGLYLKGSDLYFEWINSGMKSLATTSLTLQPNTWYHVAVVFNSSGNVTLYVNGAQMASSTSSADLLTNTGTLIIGENTSAGNYFNGTIDEVAIYSRVKSESEIAADANPVFVSLGITDSLNNSVLVRNSTSGYVNPSANNTMYLTMANNGNLNMTVGAYSGFYSLRLYIANAKVNLLLQTIQTGVSSMQAVIPIHLQIYSQVFSNLIITNK